MPYPSLSFAQMLDNATRQELEQFVSLLTGYLSQQHTDTGAHGDVTASTITVSGNATVEGDLAVNGLITSDADGSAPTFGAFTGGSGVRLPAATTGFSDWTIAAVTGTSPSKRLHFVDNRDGTRSAAFLFGDSSVGTGSINYSFLPWDSTVGINFGENTSGLRLGEANFKVVRSDNYLYENRRTNGVGVYTDVSYTAGDYTCNGGDTWTVQSGDMSTFMYTRVGDRMDIELKLDGTSIASGTASMVSIKLPGGVTAQKTKAEPCIIFDNTTTAFELGIAQVTAAGTTIDVFRAALGAYSISANNTSFRIRISVRTA